MKKKNYFLNYRDPLIALFFFHLLFIFISDSEFECECIGFHHFEFGIQFFFLCGKIFYWNLKFRKSKRSEMLCAMRIVANMRFKKIFGCMIWFLGNVQNHTWDLLQRVSPLNFTRIHTVLPRDLITFRLKCQSIDSKFLFLFFIHWCFISSRDGFFELNLLQIRIISHLIWFCKWNTFSWNRI